jgi:hypothetical protein
MKPAILSLLFASIGLALTAFSMDTSAGPAVRVSATPPLSGPIVVRPAELPPELEVVETQTLVAFDLSNTMAPHVITVACGGWGTKSVAKATVTNGEGSTPQEAIDNAMKKMLDKLWPGATHGCAECANPGRCEKVIYHDDTNPPTAEVFPNVATPYMAVVKFSGTYWWACTACN